MDLAGFVIIGFIALIFLGLAGYILHFIYRMVKGERLTEDERPKREGDQPKPDPGENAKMAYYFIAVLLVAIWFFFGRHYVGPPDYRLDATKLYSEYAKSELTAHAFTGEVATTGVSLGAPWVILRSGGFKGVQCFFPKKRTAEAASLQKGSTVTVKGVMMEKLGFVMLGKCSKV